MADLIRILRARASQFERFDGYEEIAVELIAAAHEISKLRRKLRALQARPPVEYIPPCSSKYRG
jgi:hypothetical protein